MEEGASHHKLYSRPGDKDLLSPARASIANRDNNSRRTSKTASSTCSQPGSGGVEGSSSR